MPVQIGAKTHNFTDPTGLLSDCHRRIEMFMGTLEAVAAVIDRDLDSIFSAGAISEDCEPGRARVPRVTLGLGWSGFSRWGLLWSVA
jgi:hypothetical protein